MRVSIALRRHPWSALAIAAVIVLGVTFPIFGASTQYPLAVFVLPILVATALGSARETAVVGALATVTALVVGLAAPLDTAGLLVRMAVVVTSAVVAVALAVERNRREEQIDTGEERMQRVASALHAGKAGTWEWNRATGEVVWDDDLHQLFGLRRGEFEGTFDGWVARLHPDDRNNVLAALDRGVKLRDVFSFDHRCVWPDGTSHWLHGVGQVIGDDDEVTGAVGLAMDIDERVRLLDIERRAAERARFLERTHRALVESLDLDEVVDRITSAAIEELAAWCSLAVTIDHPVDAPLIAVAHADPDMVVWAKELQRRFPFDPAGETGVAQVIRTGEPDFVPIIDAALLDATPMDAELREIIDELDLRSSIIVPLVGGLGPLGALQLVRTSSQPHFTAADLGLAKELAGPISAALNNTILFRRQQTVQRGLAALERLTATLANSSDVTHIAEEAVRSARSLVDATKSLLYLADAAGQFQLVAGTGYTDDELEGWTVLDPAQNAPVAEALRKLTPVVLESRQEINARYPYMADVDSDDAAMVTMPLIRSGRLIGALYLAWDRPRSTSETELQLLRDVSARCAGALERARLHERQRAIALTLQRSLLPSHLGTTEWFDTTGDYWPGEAGAEVGGDFYDLFEIEPDRWGITIGDVCGKGIEAAALTSVARHTARSAARHVNTPSEVLMRVHEALLTYDGTNYCTVCFAFLERVQGHTQVRVALGGHPQPLLRRASGNVEPLGIAGTLLGLIEPRLETTVTSLARGDTLLFYTDGLTDAPGALAVPANELHDTLAAAAPTAVACAEAIRQLLHERRPDGVSDDTAILVVGITADGSSPAGPPASEV